MFGSESTALCIVSSIAAQSCDRVDACQPESLGGATALPYIGRRDICIYITSRGRCSHIYLEQRLFWLFLLERGYQDEDSFSALDGSDSSCSIRPSFAKSLNAVEDGKVYISER